MWISTDVQVYSPLVSSNDQNPATEVDDPQAEAARAEALRIEQLRESDDLKWLMGHQQGRRIIWRLLSDAGVFRSSFTGDHTTYFREGMRNMGLILLGKITEHCPERYHLMVKEHYGERSKSSTRPDA